MLSHLPNSPFPLGFNPAVSAVICFYFISGYLMYFSFYKEVRKGLSFQKQILFFYIKRVLRLFPLYLIVLFLTMLVIAIWGPSQMVPLLHQELGFSKIFLNVLLIFNNYVFDPFIIKPLLPHPLIPPTWSLSTEWHFYLLVPFFFYLFARKPLVFVSILLISMGFEFFAFSHQTGVHLNSDNFGYRYIFGVLWIFMVGFFYAAGKYRVVLKILYVFVFLFFLSVAFTWSTHPFVREIFLAILFLPFIPKIMRIPFRYDPFFGHLSYPIFLSHFFIFLALEKLGFTHPGLGYYWIVFGLVLLFSYGLSLVQKRIDRIRKKF
ncbi:acyltransferase family protein [Nitratiruptor sp. YY08-14]|nr:acyltransferase family protein [Nitratiruptor sp. YY08-10]BCD64622.1 acyltransferase family protein [Nitratiruptor sp. YY08-14]